MCTVVQTCGKVLCTHITHHMSHLHAPTSPVPVRPKSQATVPLSVGGHHATIGKRSLPLIFPPHCHHITVWQAAGTYMDAPSTVAATTPVALVAHYSHATGTQLAQPFLLYQATGTSRRAKGPWGTKTPPPQPPPPQKRPSSPAQSPSYFAAANCKQQPTAGSSHQGSTVTSK